MVLKRVAAKTEAIADVFSFVIGSSPVPVAQQDSVSVLGRLYPRNSGERVLVFTNLESQGQFLWKADQSHVMQAGQLPTGPDGVWFLPQPVDGKYHPNPREGGKLSRRSEESVTAWRFVVLESDEAEADDWLRCLIQMPLRIACICESGGRSIHALVRLDATSKQDWDAKVGVIKPLLITLGADRQALSAVRLTRLAGRRVTMEDAVAQWIEWMQAELSPRTAANTSEWVRVWLREMKLEKTPPTGITDKHIRAWINDPQREDKAGSRAVRLSAIRSFFKFCSIRGWCVGDPSRLVRVDLKQLSHRQKEARKVQTFNPFEVARLVRETGGFWHAAILLSYHCGLRLGDICQLEWDCFAKPNTIAVWTDKRNRRVELPINPAIVDAISSIPVTSHQYVFPEEREIILDTTRRAYLSVQFGRLCARLDLRGKTFHSLRHTFATEHHLEGRSLAEIAEALGHSKASTEVTKGYVHEKLIPTGQSCVLEFGVISVRNPAITRPKSKNFRLKTAIGTTLWIAWPERTLKLLE